VNPTPTHQHSRYVPKRWCNTNTRRNQTPKLLTFVSKCGVSVSEGVRCTPEIARLKVQSLNDRQFEGNRRKVTRDADRHDFAHIKHSIPKRLSLWREGRIYRRRVVMSAGKPVKEKPTWSTTYSQYIRQPLHVLGLSRPIIRRYNRMDTAIGNYYTVVLVGLVQSNQDNRQSSKNNNKYQLLYTYGCTSWWWD
jgi:hypothetical protein